MTTKRKRSPDAAPDAEATQPPEAIADADDVDGTEPTETVEDADSAETTGDTGTTQDQDADTRTAARGRRRNQPRGRRRGSTRRPPAAAGRRRNRVLLVAMLVVVVVGVTAAAVGRQLLPDPESDGLSATALYDSCAEERASDYACWRGVLRGLVDHEQLDEAFDVAKKANDSVPFFTSNCHQFAHVVGQAAGELYDFDVSEAYRNGDNFCASGYHHGVLEAVAVEFGEEYVYDNVNELCAGLKEEDPYGLNHYNCVHGLGHGMMAITVDELFESLVGCDGLEDSWEANSCYSGVFMENIVSDTPTDYLRPDEPLYPCTDVEDRHKNGCYIIQTSYALRVTGDYATVFELCAGIEPQHQPTCYQSLGRDVSGNTHNDVTQTLELCGLGTTEDAQLNCFIGAAKDFVYNLNDDDPGLELCAAIEDAAMSTICTDTVTSFYAGFS